MKDDSKYPSKKPGEIGSDLMKKMDDFFYSKSSRNILDSIDSFFQQSIPSTRIPVDMYENDREWVVEVDLPGVKKENIDVNVSGDRLKIQISDDRELKKVDDKNEYYRRERRDHQTTRTVQLPYAVDKRKVKASFKNGVLEVRGPKQPKNNDRLEIE